MTTPRRTADETMVRDLMSVPVLTAALTDSLWDAWQLLVISGLRHLAVVDSSGTCLGVLSDRTALAHEPRTFEHLGTTTVGSAMEGVPRLAITPDQTAHEAAALMSLHMVDAVPVINGEDRLVGIVTSTDIVHWVAQ
jgi:CBS domain-containing protein